MSGQQWNVCRRMIWISLAGMGLLGWSLLNGAIGMVAIEGQNSDGRPTVLGMWALLRWPCYCCWDGIHVQHCFEGVIGLWMNCPKLYICIVLMICFFVRFWRWQCFWEITLFSFSFFVRCYVCLSRFVSYYLFAIYKVILKSKWELYFTHN